MLKLPNQIKAFLLVFSLTALSTSAQITASEEDTLDRFVDIENAEGRFNFFFKTMNRYNENSAYDWLDNVGVFLNSAEKIGDSTSIRQYMLMQSQIYSDLGDYDRSTTIANLLYSKKERLSKASMGILLELLDFNYSQLKFYDKQLEIREEKKELGFTKNIAFHDIYSSLGLHRRAMKDYIMENMKKIDENDYYESAVYNNNIGKYLLLDKSAFTARSSFMKAKGFIDIFLNDITETKTEKDITDGNLLKGIIEGNIGKCHVELSQFEDAVPLLENSIATLKEYNVGRFALAVIENRLELTECLLQLEKYKEAKENLEIPFNTNRPELVVKRNRLWSTYYDKIGDYKNATFFLKKNVRLQDSVKTNDKSLKKQQLQVLAEYNFEYQQQILDEKEAQIVRSANEMQAKDERINLVFISLIFTLLGFAGLVYAYLKSIKNQRLIAEQKHIIENSLVEKDSLLKEIHHRVKNNLQMVSSLLSLQTKNTRSKAAIAALEEGKSRVKAMALIHQKLYQNDDLSVIEMQGYIESLINSVQSVYLKGGHNINITIDAEGVELDIDRAIPFGLILNELVSNSFKYAFPDGDENGKIYIHLRKNGELGFFEYTDNGVGLPEDSDERAKSSMGIRLMNRLVNQLQSALNIDKTAEGVRFWFDFK